MTYSFKLIKSSVYYDVEKISNGLNSDFLWYQRCLKWLLFLIAAPISLIMWLVFRILSRRYKISIYVLPTFRPGIASMYLSTIEPLCRELQYINDPKHFTILINPQEEINRVLTKSYEPHFSLYLDDRRKFVRLVAYLIPQKGLRKFYLTGKRKFDAGWAYPPSRNYVNQGIHFPNDLKKLGIETGNYVLFVHPSSNYYQRRFPESHVNSMVQANFDLTNYEQPLFALAKQDLQIVRVGLHVNELPKSIIDIPIIDYARGEREETSELWLYENCKLLISVASNGAFWFARRFNRPTIITDSPRFVQRYFSTLYTPYLLKDIKTNKLLSFRQMHHLNSNHDLNNEELNRSNKVQIIPNSPSTLTSSINETLDYANGLTHMDSADKELLDKYSNFCQEVGLVFNANTTRPTISFLREYSHLLD